MISKFIGETCREKWILKNFKIVLSDPVFWDITPRSPLKVIRRFERTSPLSLISKNVLDKK